MTILALVIVGYGAIVAAMYLFQRRLIYLPDRSRPSPTVAGVPEMAEHAVTTEDGITLTSWYRPAGQGRPTLVYMHGNGGHVGYRADRVRPYLDAGFGVLLVGYRGYGGNPGTPCESGLYADARAALGMLDKAGVSAHAIVLYGESLGTAVAVAMAAECAAVGPAVAAVILEAPPSSVVDVAAYYYPVIPVRWLMKDRFETIARIAQIGAPLQIVHGDADRVVPIRFGRRLFAAAREPKEAVWVTGGGHENLANFGLHDTVTAFLGRHGIHGCVPGCDARG